MNHEADDSAGIIQCGKRVFYCFVIFAGNRQESCEGSFHNNAAKVTFSDSGSCFGVRVTTDCFIYFLRLFNGSVSHLMGVPVEIQRIRHRFTSLLILGLYPKFKELSSLWKTLAETGYLNHDTTL